MKIALVCDFYFPSVGGVEMHIQQLASLLSKRGNKVLIITHHYDDYIGIKTDPSGFRIYYLRTAYSRSLNVVYPTFIFGYSQARKILMKQGIQIVHCHQSASALGLQYGIYAKFMGLKVVHTEHSLFGFQSLFDIHLNKLISTVFNDYDRFIAVSRTTRNNLILRANLNPKKTVVIPNGVLIKIHRKQGEKIAKFQDGFLHVVVLGRLVYRRGTDLLISILPEFCENNPKVKIHVIGDGPKSLPLKFMIEKARLNEQVDLLGSLPNSEALKLVEKCDIFLNTALTESFGIALVEAASLGLLCVSTNVGSIWEILPQEIIELVEPDKDSIIAGLEKALKKVVSHGNDQRRAIPDFGYHWDDCVDRVEEVYSSVQKEAKNTRKQLVVNNLKRRQLLGSIFLVFMLIYLLIDKISVFFDKKSFKKGQE